MTSLLLAVDDGIVNGNFDFGDLLFLVAFILFAVAFVWAIVDKSIQGALMLGGLAALALGWFVI